MAQVPNPMGGARAQDHDGSQPPASASASPSQPPSQPPVAREAESTTTVGERPRRRWSIAVTGLALVLAGGFLVEVLLVFEIVRFAADLDLAEPAVVATTAALIAAACAALVGWVLAVVAIRRRQARLLAWIAVIAGALGFMLAVVLGLVALGLAGS